MDQLRKKFGSSPTKGVEAERQSLFHAPLVSWDAASVSSSQQGIVDHLEKLNQFSRTGLEAVNQLSNLLQGTRYSELSQNYKDRFSEIDEATQAEVVQVTTQVKVAMGKVMPRGGSTDDATPTYESDTDIKLVACTLARLMQLHCQFFITASEVLEPLSRQVMSEGLLTDNCVLADSSTTKPAAGQLDSASTSAKDKNQSDHNQATEQGSSSGKSFEVKANVVNGPGNIGSPSGLRKISSFFSKLGRSGSTSSESGQSSFYVSIPKEEEKENIHKESGAGEKEEDKIEREAEKVRAAGEDGLNNAMNEMHVADSDQNLKPPSGVQPNGRLATQEELDSVIDLLSGGQRSPMQVIPENVPSHHVSKAIGSHFSQSPAPPPPMFSMVPDPAFYRNQPPPVQPLRRPDGMQQPATTDGYSREHKTNTWPYRPQQRGSVGDIGTGSMSHNMYDVPSSDMEYSRYLASIKAMKPGYPTSIGQPGPWSNTPDNGLNKSWPVHLYNHNDGGENCARNWSTIGDSSSCSDESSTGDTPWMMGLDLMGAVNDKRRHSSGEESFPAGPGNRVPEARPRSVENLLDSKSTNTWPPKQPWAKGPEEAAGGGGGGGVAADHGGALPPQPAHPPLTMQWSDPLTNRPLSTWGAGRYGTELL